MVGNVVLRGSAGTIEQEIVIFTSSAVLHFQTVDSQIDAIRERCRDFLTSGSIEMIGGLTALASTIFCIGDTERDFFDGSATIGYGERKSKSSTTIANTLLGSRVVDATCHI